MTGQTVVSFPNLFAPTLWNMGLIKSGRRGDYSGDPFPYQLVNLLERFDWASANPYIKFFFF